MTQTWNAFQIAWSNGAYAGKTVTFMTPEGAVTGELRRADSSSEKPGHTLILAVTGNTGKLHKDSEWFAVPNETLVEVAA